MRSESANAWNRSHRQISGGSAVIHCFGVTGCILSCTHAGAEIDLLLYFKTEIVSETLLREQCTGLSGVPTMLIGLADYAEKHNLSYPNLHKGELAGSICAEKTFKRITKFLYEDIMVSYGQTEASPSITFSKPETVFGFGQHRLAV
jgi:fatty-acyl-CoA synthase/long-chain acyl-CoA synthetase